LFNYFLNNNRDDISYSVKEYSKWDFIKRRYLSEQFRIKEYYRNKNRAVDNRNMISRLVDTLKGSIGSDVVTYLKDVGMSARYMSKQFGIVSNINNGVVFKSVIYGANSYEVFLYTENEIDLDKIELNWKDIESIRAIKTGDTDLDFYVPFNEGKDFSEPTVNVFEIDIVHMMLQYYYWARERSLSSDSTNTNVFIATIVYPNITDSIMDLAIFNRYLAINNDTSIRNFRIKHPFNVLNYSDAIDHILYTIKKDSKNESMALTQLLKSIPAIDQKDMSYVLNIHHKYYTMQSIWVLHLGRIEYINGLLDILSTKGKRRNRDILYTIPYTLKNIERRMSSIMNILPTVIGDKFLANIELLKEKAGKR